MDKNNITEQELRNFMQEDIKNALRVLEKLQNDIDSIRKPLENGLYRDYFSARVIQNTVTELAETLEAIRCWKVVADYAHGKGMEDLFHQSGLLQDSSLNN